MSKRFAVALLCVVLAGCGAVTLLPLRAKLTPASNRHAAQLDAHYLLGLLALPAGAIRSSSEPPSRLRSPAGTPATPNLVDVHAWWRVKGTMSGVVAFIKAHVPGGSKSTGFGRFASGRVVLSREVDFSWPEVSGVLGNRTLVVEVAPLSRGYSGVRADAQVIWVQPKPAAERVPAAARVLTVSEGFPTRKPMLAFTTENAAKVEEIATMLNVLPIVQPGVVNCPDIPVAPIVTFTFRERRDGQVLASASTAAIGPRGECPGIYFTVDRRAQPSLFAQPEFLRAAERALGVTLLTK